MKLILAPMEGVVDFQMRQLLTDIGGFDLCVTEFVRIVNQLLPSRVFYRYCEELNNAGKTKSGTPVRIQLLGQDPHWLAENAYRAIELGSHGIDLNFGCPAKTVNKSKGGAVLLKDPERIYNIISTVRNAVPATQQVSAKIRLGFDDTSLTQEIFDALVQAKADSIAIHARTKKDGYRPPAYWEKIKPLFQTQKINIVANGEVWNLSDYKRCKELSGCADVMLGRGALAQPDLAKQLASYNNSAKYDVLNWQNIIKKIITSSQYDDSDKSTKYFPSRTKQWLRYLLLCYKEAEDVFSQIKTLNSKAEVLKVLEKQITPDF